VTALSQALSEYEEKVEALQTECKSKENALIISKQQQDQCRKSDLELIKARLVFFQYINVKYYCRKKKK